MKLSIWRLQHLVNLAAALSALVAVALVAYSYQNEGLVATMLSAELTANDKITALRTYILAWGIWAPAAYILFVVAEVLIAPLPGLLLYAPGGALFGWFWGGLYSLTGNILGAAIACQTVRFLSAGRLGARIRATLKPVSPLLEDRGLWVIFALRINPFTSSDLISYAAGLTTLPLWKVLLGTALGMAPLCWAQAYLAEGILDAVPWLVYPIFAACGLYGLIAIWVLRGFASRNNAPVTSTEP